MSEEVKLNTEEADRVEQVIEAAFSEMETVSRSIASDAGRVSEAVQCSGTGIAMENYEGLGRHGQLLAEILQGLANDLKVTISTGVQTDESAASELGRGGTGSVPDPTVSAAI